jgi:hypothetical protein
MHNSLALCEVWGGREGDQSAERVVAQHVLEDTDQPRAREVSRCGGWAGNGACGAARRGDQGGKVVGQDAREGCRQVQVRVAFVFGARVGVDVVLRVLFVLRREWKLPTAVTRATLRRSSLHG